MLSQLGAPSIMVLVVTPTLMTIPEVKALSCVGAVTLVETRLSRLTLCLDLRAEQREILGVKRSESQGNSTKESPSRLLVSSEASVDEPRFAVGRTN